MNKSQTKTPKLSVKNKGVSVGWGIVAYSVLLIAFGLISLYFYVDGMFVGAFAGEGADVAKSSSSSVWILWTFSAVFLLLAVGCLVRMVRIAKSTTSANKKNSSTKQKNDWLI